MKNNKGFTLVELLAVIVVLALIIGIAVPNAINLSNKSKKKMYISKVEMIIKAAQLYGEDHPKGVATSESACSSTSGRVTVETLVKDGKVKADKDDGTVEDPYSGASMNSKTLCIYKQYNRVYAKITGCTTSGTKKYWMANNVDVADFCS